MYSHPIRSHLWFSILQKDTTENWIYGAGDRTTNLPICGQRSISWATADMVQDIILNIILICFIQILYNWNTAYWTCLLALLLGCCSGAKQLCCSGQQATALYVFYLQWNLYEPRVTSTWMGPSVLAVLTSPHQCAWDTLVKTGTLHG